MSSSQACERFKSSSIENVAGNLLFWKIKIDKGQTSRTTTIRTIKVTEIVTLLSVMSSQIWFTNLWVGIPLLIFPILNFSLHLTQLIRPKIKKIKSLWDLMSQPLGHESTAIIIMFWGVLEDALPRSCARLLFRSFSKKENEENLAKRDSMLLTSSLVLPQR